MDSHVFQQKRKQYRVLSRQYLRLLKKSEKSINDGLTYTAENYLNIASAVEVKMDQLQAELDVEKFTSDTDVGVYFPS